MKITNMIALLRVAVLPLIIFFLYQETVLASFMAITLFIFSLLGGVLSAVITKKTRSQKKIGSFLSPFINKLLIISLIFVLSLRGSLWWGILVIFLLRDIIVGVIHWIAANDDVYIKVGMMGGLTVASQLGIIFSVLLGDFFIYDWLQHTRWMITSQTLVVIFTFCSVFFGFISAVKDVSLYIAKIHSRKKYGKQIKQEKLIILANKRSRGYYDGYRRHLLRVFAKRRKAKIVYLPPIQEMYQGVDQEVRDFKQVIIAGGDGSFEGALNYGLLKKKSLGFFPLGAGNSFYSYFYKGKRFEYLRSRFNFKEMDLDVIEVEWDCGKLETLFLSIGVDAEFARLSQKRTQEGPIDYLNGFLKSLFCARADFKLNCKVDDNEYYWDNLINLTLGKVPFYGYNMRSLIGFIEPDDNRVYGLACINTHSFLLNKPLRLWGIVLTAFGINKSPNFSFRGTEIVIQSEVPLPMQAGGEFLGYTHHLKVRIKRKQKVLFI